jgi:hypothetical protein
MTIAELLSDKTKKAKAKVETISKWLLDGSLQTEELIVFAEQAKDPEKGTCIHCSSFGRNEALAFSCWATVRSKHNSFKFALTLV